MPSCCVLIRCPNYYTQINKNRGISYHSFPSDAFMKHKWVCIVQRERNEYDWMPTRNSAICSVHFKHEDKCTTLNGYMRLKKTAIPVIEGLVTKNDHVYNDGNQDALEDSHSSDSSHSKVSCSETFLTLKRKLKEDFDLHEGQDNDILSIPTYVKIKQEDLEDVDVSVPNLSPGSCSQKNIAYGNPIRESHIEYEPQDTMDVTAREPGEEPGSPISDVSIHSNAADPPEEQAIDFKLRQKIEMLNQNAEVLKRVREEISTLEKKHKELLADIKYLQNVSKKKIKSFELNEL